LIDIAPIANWGGTMRLLGPRRKAGAVTAIQRDFCDQQEAV